MSEEQVKPKQYGAVVNVRKATGGWVVELVTANGDERASELSVVTDSSKCPSVASRMVKDWLLSAIE